LDLNMRGLSGLDTLKAIKAGIAAESRVIILTVSDSEEDVVAALRAGLTAICSRIWSRRMCCTACRIAAQGRMALVNGLQSILADALRHESQIRPACRVLD
jgi:two-component system nitrate/nitrite response regulator NarL